jgi:hypothetical protein
MSFSAGKVLPTFRGWLMATKEEEAEKKVGRAQ